MTTAYHADQSERYYDPKQLGQLSTWTYWIDRFNNDLSVSLLRHIPRWQCQHSSGSAVKGWLREQERFSYMDWLPPSPDLNKTENLWDVINNLNPSIINMGSWWDIVCTLRKKLMMWHCISVFESHHSTISVTSLCRVAPWVGTHQGYFQPIMFTDAFESLRLVKFSRSSYWLTFTTSNRCSYQAWGL